MHSRSSALLSLMPSAVLLTAAVLASTSACGGTGTKGSTGTTTGSGMGGATTVSSSSSTTATGGATTTTSSSSASGCTGACDGGTDAGADTGTSTPPDAGPVTCPTSVLARTVGAHRSALPAMTWAGSGYTIIIDEVVSESPFVLELTYEKTDGTGALLSGPTALTQNDGVSRNWPRVAFSGTEYGITYTSGGAQVFQRFDASLVPVPNSLVTLSTAQGTAAVAWSGQAWGVAWGDSSLHFQRFDAAGAPLGSAMSLGVNYLSDNGVPLIATSTGWAVVGTGYPAVVHEIDADGTVRSVPLSFNASRASIASNGNLYAVAADSMDPLHDPGELVMVQRGSSLTAGTAVTFGTHASEANVIWYGASFLVTWSETINGDPQPLQMTTVPPNPVVTPFFGTPFTTETNAGFHQLATGPCGWAVLYGTFTTNQLAELEVRP